MNRALENASICSGLYIRPNHSLAFRGTENIHSAPIINIYAAFVSVKPLLSQNVFSAKHKFSCTALSSSCGDRCHQKEHFQFCLQTCYKPVMKVRPCKQNIFLNTYLTVLLCYINIWN